MGLPNYIAPRRLAEEQGRLSATVAVDRFERLVPPYRNAGALAVGLKFLTDAHGRSVVEGELNGHVMAACQRCLRDLDIDVAVAFRFVVIGDESQAAGIDAGDDYIVADDDRLNILKLVEDELLLALPMVPVHGDDVCAPLHSDQSVPAGDNPFAQLAALKKRS